jgi:hypothetical protein
VLEKVPGGHEAHLEDLTYIPASQISRTVAVAGTKTVASNQGLLVYIVCKAEVPSNMPLGIIFSELGSSIVTSPLSRKAFSPIVFTWLGASNMTELRFVQP